MNEERRKDHIAIEPILQDMRQELKDIKKLLLGNGRLGVLAKVSILWSISIGALCIAGTALARSMLG